MPGPADAESRPSLLYVIGRVDQGIRTLMRKRLAEWGLSIAEYTALSVLRERPGLSNAQLSRRSLIMPQSMIEVLTGLEARGLVRRETDPQHSRILRAELTDEGGRLLASVEPAIDALQDDLLAGVPAERRAVVLNALVEVMDRLAVGLDDLSGKP
jgi:DNA-binding MarR family transcriptional regulator